ncbi:Rne/Rng family ribonuclease [Gulosibacter bifidus]|uniref:Rne/Rng family ribonuclease n=1 Tax=Gulosibacter bifidus TaxID=272239 RepID=A0ABW5RJD5_9MICO|nr:Rne/Rng family ribonuclease [Gulosibacter bifidus]
MTVENPNTESAEHNETNLSFSDQAAAAEQAATQATGDHPADAHEGDFANAEAQSKANEPEADAAAIADADVAAAIAVAATAEADSESGQADEQSASESAAGADAAADAPSDKAKSDKPKIDETKAADSKNDETKADAEDKADGTKSDESKADDAKGDADKRDPRIPAVITNRTLFFLEPDLPPMPEASRERRNRRDEQQDEEQEDSRGRRGRRRGRRGNAKQEQPQQDDTRVEEHDDEEEEITEPQAVKGSTRLAAKRARRRDNRDIGRRRTVVTESEFQARREAVNRTMLVRSMNNRVQIGVLEDNVLVEHYVARNEDVSLIGNVYLGRVQNVLPSMEAAFVDIGEARNAVLYSGEVDWAASDLGPNQPRKIENALKPGDRVLVQVTKDPVGHKGARLTSQMSLPGRYLVYVPGNTMNGISRKLPENERARLKKILKEVLPEGVGVIVRTAAEGATHEQLQRDVERLMRQWEDIKKRSGAGAKAPQTLHAEPDMLIKIIRDVFNEDFQKLIIQGQSESDTIKHYLGQVAPDLLDRVERYTGDDIFAQHRVNDMIEKALARKVFLPSGGSLVIDRTEAMTVIDVNTGKFVGSGGNLEETVTKNNLEAAEEIVRQLRLRDIGGIIVIDFIDMVLESNRNLVHRRLLEGLSRDRTKHQVAEVTSLGLVQMTRKKIGLGLLETFSEPCSSCLGRGVHVHSEPVFQGGQSSGKGKSSRRNRNNQKQSRSQSSTHEITDDARSALTKIAASTLAGAEKDESNDSNDAAEKLAKAVQVAAAGKSGSEVLAAAGEAPESNERDSRDQESRDSGRKRSRRGRRGRGKNQDARDEQRSNGEQGEGSRSDRDANEPAPSESSAEVRGGNRTNEPATQNKQASQHRDTTESRSREAPAAQQQESSAGRKPRRRRVSTDMLTADAGSGDAGSGDAATASEPTLLGLELPEPKQRRARHNTDASATLASLDAALDQIAGGGADASQGSSAARQAPAKESAPAVQTRAAGEVAPAVSDAADVAAQPKKKPRRRRVTTGTISTEASDTNDE